MGFELRTPEILACGVDFFKVIGNLGKYERVSCSFRIQACNLQVLGSNPKPMVSIYLEILWMCFVFLVDLHGDTAADNLYYSESRCGSGGKWNRRPHGCELSGLKPLPRTSQILNFANRVVSSKWVAVWTTVLL